MGVDDTASLPDGRRSHTCWVLFWRMPFEKGCPLDSLPKLSRAAYNTHVPYQTAAQPPGSWGNAVACVATCRPRMSLLSFSAFAHFGVGMIGSNECQGLGVPAAL